ncbi:M3 family oligoendopeptidase [Fodinicurvata fenggangensis]|uniref:M3 family oligoendopeptidase n=1 Tax=Fodinicurvata fenggangensis TaxID=1121830 RepID=UPI00047D0A28|nr:M3 family oligoendopeptidase [Fodinicurvata fenggangensis]
MSKAQNSTVESQNLGQLPVWDLNDLYPSKDSAELKRDLSEADEKAHNFEAGHAGRLAALTGDQLGDAIEVYEDIQEKLGRIMSYAQLVYAADMTDGENGRFYQSMQERATDISSHLLFFELELNRLSDSQIQSMLESSERLSYYKPWLRDLRAYQPYQLSDEVERTLHEKHITGRAAWTRLFDETFADLRFELDGKALSSTEILDKLSSPDRALRERAARSFAAGLKENERSFALITNTLAKDKQIEDQWRGFARPVSSRNLANFVEDEVVDALVSAATESFPRLSHRYYAMKAKWLGLDKLAFWDRNAPLPETDERIIPWEEAQDTVLNAYAAFSDDLANVGKRFFEQDWIDAPARQGKSPGAFAHPTVPAAHPYLLLNYQGHVRDVMTLAHELGHGVHQVLAGPQGPLMADTPLTLAETASVFGEMLTFRSLLASTWDPAKRKAMLASKVEDMLNTVVRQIAFHNFETRVHDRRRGGELSQQDLADIWMETQREALGPAFDLDEDYRIFWSYIPHFIHTPFYVYAYAFGDCLVNSLYAVYQQADEGFAEKYLDMLRAGGTKRHRELLAPFGLDASDPAFWQKGLSVIEGMIDELESLDD